MRQTISNLWALLLAAGVLFVGSGLQGSLLAVRANSEGFLLTQIGLLMATYSAGFVAGCQLTPVLVKNVGHIRTFTALASVASAVALAHALAVNPILWMILRGLSGFCFAGLSMVIESWINEKATNANRGRVLSVYRVVDLGCLTIGQLLLNLADPASFVLFAVVSILVSMSLVPVALSTAVAPQPIESAQLDLRKVFRISPLAAIGTLLVGLASSAFWSIGPVYVLRLGYDIAIVSAFMSLAIVSGALAQWPLGAMSDRMDRRIMVVVVTAMSAASGLVLVFTAAHSVVYLLAGGALFGAFAMSLFGLFVAQANDHAEPASYVALNAGLLLLYGLGSVAGPLIASVAMKLYGSAGLFGYTTVVYVLMLIYSIWRMTQRASIPVDDQEDYVAIPPTSPMVFELDPKTDDES